jgi:hypothetical protein
MITVIGSWLAVPFSVAHLVVSVNSAGTLTFACGKSRAPYGHKLAELRSRCKRCEAKNKPAQLPTPWVVEA